MGHVGKGWGHVGKGWGHVGKGKNMRGRGHVLHVVVVSVLGAVCVQCCIQLCEGCVFVWFRCAGRCRSGYYWMVVCTSV